MAPAEGRVAKSERRWGWRRGIPTRPLLSMGFEYQQPSWQMTSRLICPGSPTKWCQGCKQHNFNSRRILSCYGGCGWHLLASNFAKKKQQQAAVLRWQCWWYWTECCRFISYQRRRQVHANWTGPASSLQVPVSTCSSIPFTQFLSTASPSVGTRCQTFTRCTRTLTTMFTTASVMAASSSTVVSTQFFDLSFANFTCFLARRDLCDDVESWAVASGSRWCFAQCSLSLSCRERL